jgi:hypothetical protein
VEIAPWWVLSTLEWLILLLNVLKWHLVTKFSKPEKQFKKNQVQGAISLESFEGDLSPIPPLAKTLTSTEKKVFRVMCLFTIYHKQI